MENNDLVKWLAIAWDHFIIVMSNRAISGSSSKGSGDTMLNWILFDKQTNDIWNRVAHLINKSILFEIKSFFFSRWKSVYILFQSAQNSGSSVNWIKNQEDKSICLFIKQQFTEFIYCSCFVCVIPLFNLLMEMLIAFSFWCFCFAQK